MITTEFLANFWALTIAGAAMIYLVLDGFDLGVGVLFGVTSNEQYKRKMLDAIAPVWDGNETWLVIVGAALYGAFPMVYAIVLPALYLPTGLLLIALIARGITFEFRYKMKRGRRILDMIFCAASFTVSFVLGAAIGAVMQGISVEHGRYSGAVFEWLTPFSVLCGFGLVAGHILLGAGWLVLKTRNPLQDWAYALLPKLVLAMVILFFLAHFSILYQKPETIAASLQHPLAIGLLCLVPIAAVLVYAGSRSRTDWIPFTFTCAIFLFAFAAAVEIFWPYILPFSHTISQAAAPVTSLEFLFYGAGLIAIPLCLVYTSVVFWIFRGKITDDTEFDYER